MLLCNQCSHADKDNDMSSVQFPGFLLKAQPGPGVASVRQGGQMPSLKFGPEVN